MIRVTKKEKGIYDIKERTTQKNEFHIMPSTMIEICQKLGQLEDIEEEIGIDLIKLFEIYKKLLDLKSLWYKGEVSGYEYIYIPKYNQVVIDFEEMTLLILDYGEVVDSFHFKDYGRTWALTKEELGAK